MNNNQFGKNNPNYKHGDINTRLYNIWHGIKQRCLYPKFIGYKNYGGRGITICNEWLEFIPFRDWALDNGYTENLVIDRIENGKGYYPENCRWITIKESNRNKGSIKLSFEIAEEIRSLFATGKYTKRFFAKKYNTSDRNIKFVIDKVTWNNE